MPSALRFSPKLRNPPYRFIATPPCCSCCSMIVYSLAFDCTCCHPSNQLFLQQQIENDDRNECDSQCCHLQGEACRLNPDEVGKTKRQRLQLRRCNQHQRKQILIPVINKVQNNNRDERRSRNRQDNMPKYPKKSRSHPQSPPLPAPSADFSIKPSNIAIVSDK
ncbi:hypothetical protein COLO4_02451 [Corchorus olitorius]|uniref:Uncharacterized protein n=1 Tax=Corchorus olitorius TaxID=93759 RepID=A0A1R3L0X5_9ROSI|nr:hypothetical protein COLO4_02451 [Corchorus olitorius]